MSSGTLRTVERDLYAAAKELRGEDIPEAEARIDALEAEARELLADDDTIPPEKEREYQQAKQQLRELHGTAETYGEYADRWSAEDADECVFVLEELNGDEYAAVTDAVRAEAGPQARQNGTVPEGYGRIKALEYGVEEIPENCPATPGEWPAPIVNELFSELEGITAPTGVDLGNESLASAVEETVAEPDTNTPPTNNATSPPAEPSSPE